MKEKVKNEIVETKTASNLTLMDVKQYICPEATDVEAMFFLQLCKAQGINPFLKEAYLVKYKGSPATMITGKEFFLKKANSKPEYRGFKAGIIVGDRETKKIQDREGSFKLPSEQLLGGWATVSMAQREPMEIRVSLDEYVGKNKNGEPTSMWAKKPCTMIRKVAIVQCIREAFPNEFAASFIAEEVGDSHSELVPEETGAEKLTKRLEIPVPKKQLEKQPEKPAQAETETKTENPFA